MLTVEGLAVRYGRVAALREISFDVQEREIVAIVGPNGAGKSTTLAAITGTVTPYAGSITYLGKPLIGQSPERIVREGIALIINQEADMEVVGSCASGEEAVSLHRACRPDVTLMDLRLGKMSGVDAIKVGIGPGGGCSTRLTTNFGVPQVEALVRCRQAVGPDLPVIADGGIKRDGSLALAFVVGGDRDPHDANATVARSGRGQLRGR